ncbi:MAG: hypothetical protein KKE20_05335 [Nanoarchaeota archaeon]|nr:hypothetical protein [Nanoarchaeota archaeon]
MTNKKDIAIVFPSGRRFVKDVVSMLAGNLRANGHLDSYNPHLIISYDPTFYGLRPSDFRIPEETSHDFSSVTYLGPESHLDFSLLKDIPGVTEEAFDVLLKPRGYCSQKNRAIISALSNRAEHITFLDDDEYFVAPFKNGKLEWVSQDVLGVHLRHNVSADITQGAHTGYFSPIPSDLDANLEEQVRKNLGLMLSVGNEVINERTFLNTQESVKYADPAFSLSSPYEIPEINGVRGLSGGNITLNSESIRNSRIPPYYNPPGARGEDAILGMQIRDISALKIPVYTFHDPFQKYSGITSGQYPEEIEAIKVTCGTIDRFCKACIGWLRYAPLLIRLTSHSESEYEERIHRMREPLDAIGNDISNQLFWGDFNKMAPTLDEYDAKSKLHAHELEVAREAWPNIVKLL